MSRKGILRVRTASRNTSALNDVEKGILVLANGERTIEDIVKRCGLDEYQALSAMHVLCALHITDLLPPQRGAKPAPERVASAPPPPPPAPAAPRGGATNEFPPRVEAGPGTAPPEARSKASKSGPGSAESTAKLRALPEIATPAIPTRVLRIVGDDKTREVPLTASTFSIGRHPRNDLVLKDPRISSFHCRIEAEGDKYVILDLKSRNGTLLNSARIDRAVMKPNDIIQLGSTKISYFED
ncbi:MAG: FHA domain-containing protein [Vicinamibacteria bacterium]|nr:FHA domain-containing protein [Vicinamibacteria bacterium]